MLQKIKNALMGTWERIKRTFWLFIGFLASQAVIQVMNFIAGIVILRFLPKDDYAAYTIMNTIVPVMLMLSDTGIGTGIFAIGRLVWEDNQKSGELINTGLQLRRKFAIISFSLVGPFLAWMLFRNNVPILTIVLLLVNSLVFISFQLTGTVMKAILTLRQQFKLQMQTGIGITVLRFVMVLGFAYLFYLNAVLAVFATTLSIVVETLIVTRGVRPQVVWDAPVNPEYRKQMLGLVKQTLPLTVYFCISGQLSIWLLGIFGSAHQVADIGAAGRLGLIFTTISSSFSAIMVTQFAKANGRRRLFRMSIEIVACLTVMLGSVVALAFFWPAPFLWLLGEKYNNMANLIWLVVLSSGVSSLAGSIFGLNTCKGWIPPAVITIPIEIATQVILISCLDVSKIKSVLILTTLAAIPPTIVNAVMLARRIRQEPE